MNLYFLVEGSRTEIAIYTEWLSHLHPGLTKIADPFLLNRNETLDNTYYLFSGGGYPSLLDNHLVNAVNDINKIGKIDYFVICLDSENRTVEQTHNKIHNFMAENGVALATVTLEIIVHNCCIETWLLGNRRMFSRNTTHLGLLECIDTYNVKDNDPELMGSHKEGCNRAQYHLYYLKQLFDAKNENLRYSKSNPQEVCKRYYLDELISRYQETGHIDSFGQFLSFCNSLRLT